jgi:GNAT superfamily N-acetyltransferase
MAGRAAGTASFFLGDDSAYLTGGNVLTEFRGKGIYRALIRARLDALQALSIPLATTHAREKTSAPILEKLGFETVFRYSIYELKP